MIKYGDTEEMVVGSFKVRAYKDGVPHENLTTKADF
jgi:hypothetical protein